MKKYIVLLLCVMLSACSSDNSIDEINTPKNSVIKEIAFQIPELEGDASTRTSFEADDKGIRSAWAEGDTIGIFPSEGGQVEFPIVSGQGSSTAIFDGGGWGLKDTYSYSAYFPFNDTYKDKTIPLDYTGQVQTGNNNITHLVAYDYLASGSFHAKDGILNFEMKRLGSILKLEITVPRTSRYTQLYLISDNAEFVTKAVLDISGEQPQVKAKEKDKSILLDLKDVMLNEGEVLTAYLMISPVDLSSSNLSVRLRSSLGYHTANFTAELFNANKPYRFEVNSLANTLVNQNLIAAVEGRGLLFEKNEDGTVSLDNQKNLDIVNCIKTLDLYAKNDPHITDEIGWFKRLEYLRCWNNQLRTLDVSNNTALIDLYCFNNQLTSLNVSNNTTLHALSCYNNQLTSLDVSNNISLGLLECYNNQLTTLDVSNNMVLSILRCNENLLTSLNVSNNTELILLECENNQLTTLDVSNKENLYELNCESNQLATLHVINNPKLESFNCINNKLKTLIITSTKISELNCQNNQLTTLIVTKNQYLKKINCGNNQLTSLDVSNNTALTDLYCYNNQLTTLDVSNNMVLSFLSCNENQLTSLDVSNNTALTRMNCHNNLLTSLDVSNNTALYYLICYNNQLTSLDVSKNTGLGSLDCYNNQLTSLDVSNNTDLSVLQCQNNQLTTLDVSNNTRLGSLQCQNNQLTSLDVSKNTGLQYMYCYNNQLTTLDVSNNTALQYMYCYNNQLTTLDVSNNTALKYMYCYNNQLTTLDVSNNTALKSLWAFDCHLSSLDISSCTDLLLGDTYVGHQLDNSGSLQEMTLLVNESQNNEELPTYDDTGGSSLNYHINDNVKVVLKE